MGNVFEGERKRVLDYEPPEKDGVVKLTTVVRHDLPQGPDGHPLKPCCVCLDEKRERDECIILNGEEECQHLIEAHKRCMRQLGFKV